MIPDGKVEEFASSIKKLTDLVDGKLANDASNAKNIALLLTQKEAHEKAMEGVRTDVTALKTTFDKHLSAYEQFVKARTAAGERVSGTADAAKKFSIPRYVRSVLTGDKSLAPAEWDLVNAETKAAMASGDTKTGGAFIPEVVAAPINVATFAQSAFVALNPADGQTQISVIDGIPGISPISIPRFDRGGINAFWTGEAQTYTQVTADTGMQKLEPHKLGAVVPFTEEMMRGDVLGLNAMVNAAMASAFSETLDQTIAFSPGGAFRPKGIVGCINEGVKVYRAETGAVLDYAGLSGVTWAGKEITFDLLDAMQLALEEDKIKPNSSARFVTSPRAIRYLKAQKIKNFTGQTDGFGLTLGIPMVSNGALAQVIGPFTTSVNIPALEKCAAQISGSTPATNNLKFSSMFYGNLNAFVLGRWSQLEIATDGGVGTGFSNDMTKVKFRMWVGTAAMRPRELIFCPDIQVTA